MKRRQFLRLSASSAALAFMNAHGALAGEFSGQKLAKNENGLIAALRLQTITSLAVLKKFYGETIGLPVTQKNEELVIHAGSSTIAFISADEKQQRPFYHFAFNIPENKIQAAFEWQRMKTPIIHPNPSGPKEQVVHFEHWNAHSIFFLDPAGNLLEYIARHDLPNSADGGFSIKDILYASEIGLIVNDVIASGATMQKEIGISQYKDPTPGFWPIGDESGLLLMINKGRVWSGHPGQVNETGIFKTSIVLRNMEKTSWGLPGYPYEISAVTKLG